ncbi:ATP-binding protein [Phenylobacterium sp.]|uniref:ATP-binding protein n=1 Tax=Phenylobacterium sp. TaxID=1871053 RepID=UPI002F934DB5
MNRGAFAADPSGPVFDRALRLARALLGDVDAQIAVLGPDGRWRAHDPGCPIPPDLSASRKVVEAGQVLWIGDGCAACELCATAAGCAPHTRFYAGAPVRLADGTIPAVLSVAGLASREYDAEAAGRLQDLADFVADEWSRAQARADHEASARERDVARTALAGIVNTAPIPLVIVDREFRVLGASPRWKEIRAGGADVRGRNLLDIAPEVFGRFRPALDRCLTGETVSVDRLAVPSAGSEVEWVQAVVAPWRDADGEVGGLIITSHDITAVVRALEQAERSEERLRLALEIADIHVFEMDYVRQELIKAGAEDTFFEQPKTYVDMLHPWDTIDPRDRPRVQEAWTRFVEGGELYQPEYRVARSDGREVWAAGTVRLIHDEEGRPVRLVGAIQNITARKSQECALVRAKEEAEAANRAKSAFLATMSHEIRTPLNGVLGMAQAMASGELSPPQRERLEVIHQSGEALLAILNDVLDLSKIEAGKLELEQTEFDLADLARGAHATFGAVAEAKDLLFELKIQPAARGAYLGDSVRVRQILYNLVSNALKFTDRGGVRVSVGRSAGMLKMTVTDTGIGIAADKLASLFNKFEQADASTTRRYGGTGLGLAICRDLTELMGGTIAVKSRPGRGTTFSVALPLPKVIASAAPARAPVEAQPIALDDRPLRILAAEDNATNQLVLKTLLGQLGLEPVIVANGREAVEAWGREAWDLILMDVQMPEMDGPSATAVIRTQEALEGRPRTPIVALTANTMSHHVAEYLAAGMDGFIAKPIEAAKLIAALSEALNGGDGQAAADAA